jgi:hypothetical protein
MGLVKTVIDTMRTASSRWFNDDEEMDIPKKSEEEKVVAFVKSSYVASSKWRETSLRGRFTNGTQEYDDPKRLWMDCRKLRNGDHWGVWGHRNTAKDQNWKHEIVWSAVEDQCRIRKIYLTSSMHEFDVFPNINYVSDITRQDMMKSKWYDFMNELTDRAMTDGTSFGMEVLDMNLDPDGITRSIVLDPATCFPTPGATSLDSLDGNWYFIVAATHTKQYVLSNQVWAEKLKPTDLEYITEDDFKAVNIEEKYDNFKKKKLVSVMTMFLDDDKLELIPFDENEFNARVQALVEGQIPPVKNGIDSHRKYIRAYIDYLDRYASSITNPTPEDVKFFQDLSQRVLQVVNEHEQFLMQDNNADKRKQYPYGRKIVVVSGKVVEDDPVDVNVGTILDGIDWRRKIYKYDMEKVPGSFWGRGIPEILWHTNKMMDTFLSRIGDMTLYGLPEKWLNINDKETLAQQKAEYNNDPLQPKWYATSPPTMISATFSGEFILLVSKMQEGLEAKIGYNKTTMGQAPNSRASGDLVDSLLQQNQVLITGEADQNLLDLVTDIIETKIEMMRLYYTEPRQYIINGTPVIMKVSDQLKQYQGKPLAEFQVYVKPQSNYPNQWEAEFGFLAQLMQTPTPDGTPLVDPEMVKMVLGKKFPDLAPGGRYYKISQATQIGMQVLQQQKAEAEQKAKLEGKIQSRMQGNVVSQLIPSPNGEQNG